MVSTLASQDAFPRTAILTGPTGSGKSDLAAALCKRVQNIEIINSDSLLVYRGMNIGTAKPTHEERHGVPHHLIDILDPSKQFNAGDFTRLVQVKLEEIHSRGARALIVGGTGFYLKALLYGTWNIEQKDPESSAKVRKELDLLSNETLFDHLQKFDPEAAKRTGSKDRYRLIRAIEIFRQTGRTPSQLQDEMQPEPRRDLCLWWIDWSNARLEERISARTRRMLDQGLIEEYQAVLSQFGQCRALDSVGYRQVRSYLESRSPQGRKILPGIPGLENEICLATRQLVKKQRTWLKNLVARMGSGARRFHLPDDLEDFEKAFLALYHSNS